MRTTIILIMIGFLSFATQSCQKENISDAENTVLTLKKIAKENKISTASVYEFQSSWQLAHGLANVKFENEFIIVGESNFHVSRLYSYKITKANSINSFSFYFK